MARNASGHSGKCHPEFVNASLVSLTVDQEIALGLQAVPQMAAEFGGLDPDQAAQALVDKVGERLVATSAAHETPYKFEFNLLADNETINAFVLPGGPVFITASLMNRLETEGQSGGCAGP